MEHRKQAGRGRRFSVGYQLHLGIDRLAINVLFLTFVNELRNHSDVSKYFRRPVSKWDGLAVSKHFERRVAPFLRRCGVVLCGLFIVLFFKRRTVLQQTINKKGFHESHDILIGADWIEEVHVQRAYLNVFDPAAPECGCRALA